MRSAVARALAARVTAKGYGFAVGIAAVGISAVATFQLHEGEMARIDFDAAQLGRLGAREDRNWPNELGSGTFTRFVKRQFESFRLRRGRVLGNFLGAAGTGKPHARGANEREESGTRVLDIRGDGVRDCFP